MIANDILTIAAFRLLERSVKTTLTSAVAAPGAASPNVGSTKAMYVGAKVLVGTGVTREVVTVTAVLSATQFTATFANAQANGVAVVGATFPSGQTDHPLFTQSQMLNALSEAQNEFLLATRPVYATAAETVLANQRVYTKPATAIRIEHIGLDNVALRPTSQTNLDLDQKNWEAEAGIPRAWFEDKQDPGQYGFNRMPQVGGTAELWFSERGAVTLALDTTIKVPDVCSHALIYGVLARAWGSDGEAQNPFMAKYCTKRFEFIVALVQRIVGDLQLIGQAPSKFPTMAIGG